MGLSKKLQRLADYERVIWAINFALQQTQATDGMKLRAIELTLVSHDMVVKTPAIKSNPGESKNEQFQNVGPNDPKTISDLAKEKFEAEQKAKQVRSGKDRVQGPEV